MSPESRPAPEPLTKPGQELQRWVQKLRAALAASPTPEPSDGGLRAALKGLDAEVARYRTAESESAARKDWPMADRFRYLGTATETAVAAVRAALADSRPADAEPITDANGDELRVIDSPLRVSRVPPGLPSGHPNKADEGREYVPSQWLQRDPGQYGEPE